MMSSPKWAVRKHQFTVFCRGSTSLAVWCSIPDTRLLRVTFNKLKRVKRKMARVVKAWDLWHRSEVLRVISLNKRRHRQLGYVSSDI